MSTSRSRRGRSEGSIYQRSDGRWVGAVSLGKVGGKRRRLVVYGETKTEAASKLRALQGQAETGRIPGTDTVSGWLARWLTNITPTVEPATLGAYTNGYTPTRDFQIHNLRGEAGKCSRNRGVGWELGGGLARGSPHTFSESICIRSRIVERHTESTA